MERADHLLTDIGRFLIEVSFFQLQDEDKREKLKLPRAVSIKIVGIGSYLVTSTEHGES